MRTPTPHVQLYAYWHAATTGATLPAVYDDEPQAGYYKTRMRRNGPFVPVEVVCVQTVDDETGELTEPERFEARMPGGEVKSLDRLWTYLKPITVADFDALTALRSGDLRMAATEATVDLSKAPVRLK